jgi:cell division protein FtsA
VKKEKDEDEIDLYTLGISEEKRTVSRKTLVEGIIRPRLNEIFTMIGLELKRSETIGLTPSGVVVCGGGALTAGISEAVKRTLAMPVRVGLPRGVGGLIDETETPEFATAIGLIVYGAKTNSGLPATFSFSKIGKSLKKIPGRGLAGRVAEMIKSFLP